MSAPLREQLNDRIVVWIASVSRSENSRAFLERSLDRRERERADKFKFADDRARFVIGRALIRKCLGHYLQRPSEKIDLGQTDLGRPIFPQDETIQFNISHTGDIVAIAVTAHARVGIDVERVQAHPDLIELAGRVFSEKDLEAFRAIPPTGQLTAFFRAWTRKEAYLKARGEGIAEGLQQISASFGPEQTGTIIDERDAAAAQQWCVITLPMATDYMGSVACDALARRMKGRYICFDRGEIVDEVPSSLK